MLPERTTSSVSQAARSGGAGDRALKSALSATDKARRSFFFPKSLKLGITEAKCICTFEAHC